MIPFGSTIQIVIIMLTTMEILKELKVTKIREHFSCIGDILLKILKRLEEQNLNLQRLGMRLKRLLQRQPKKGLRTGLNTSR